MVLWNSLRKDIIAGWHRTLDKKLTENTHCRICLQLMGLQATGGEDQRRPRNKSLRWVSAMFWGSEAALGADNTSVECYLEL